MLAAFSCSVMLSGGRTVAVQPSTQIVRSIVAWVTAGVSAPGVQVGSGREERPVPTAWQEPGAGCDCTTSLLADEYAREPERGLVGGRGGRRGGGGTRGGGWSAGRGADGAGAQDGEAVVSPAGSGRWSPPSPAARWAAPPSSRSWWCLRRIPMRRVSRPAARPPTCSGYGCARLRARGRSWTLGRAHRRVPDAKSQREHSQLVSTWRPRASSVIVTSPARQRSSHGDSPRAGETWKRPRLPGRELGVTHGLILRRARLRTLRSPRRTGAAADAERGLSPVMTPA